MIPRSEKTACLRGQVATEFMVYSAVFMFIAIAAYIGVNHMVRTEIPFRQNTVAKGVGDGFSNAVTLSVKGGRGFTYVYPFPKTIFGAPYNITFQPDERMLVLDWDGSYGMFSYAYDLPAYGYELPQSCIENNVLTSNRCSNSLLLENDGSTLVISQESS